MADRRIFEDREQFLEALRRLVREGVPGERIRVITPFGVPEVEEILPGKRSKVRFFALVGAASGTVTGFAFTILTSLSWPLIVGGKPVVSLPPFLIIAFALTILSRLPSLRWLSLPVPPAEPPGDPVGGGVRERVRDPGRGRGTAMTALLEKKGGLAVLIAAAGALMAFVSLTPAAGRGGSLLLAFLFFVSVV
ncbi:MAG TPA: quinol:electron acceptor oxidoreductase subunit ActD [Candidatus Binatia bacterium]|nr:quinol:electron acceptor oxidoreductase subunit ActD [Candidatus Binatia bacterium]